MHHAEELLRIGSRRGHVADGGARARDRSADVLPAAAQPGDALDLVGLAHLGIERHFGRGVDRERCCWSNRRGCLPFAQTTPSGSASAGHRRIEAQGVLEPVGDAIARRRGIGRGVRIGGRTEVLDLPRIRQTVVVGVARQVGDGGLEHADGVGRVVDALAAFDINELPVPGGIAGTSSASWS